ncbi:adenosine deaminase [Paenibacillus tarimensis]
MSEQHREEIIRQMPKVDLHLHLDGCVGPATLLELAREQGAELPASEPEGLLPYMQVQDDCGSLAEYLSKFDFVLPLLQTPEALIRTAYETVKHCSAHNCKYVEVRFGPQLHRAKGLSAGDAIRYVLEGLQLGEREFGVMARAIAICMRSHSAEQNLEVVEAASKYVGHGVAAVDLAGDEASFPAGLSRDVFALAKRCGIPVTIHAGEAAGPDNIREAITNLGATRIGHGVRMRENGDVMKLVQGRGITLEMCPLSNIQTKAVRGWEDYPIREYFDAGYRVTVNTDNPTVSGTTITREYEWLAERFAFTPQELARLVMNGVDAAFLNNEEKEALRRQFIRRFNEMGLVIG